MTIQVGDKLPSVTLTTMTEEGPKPVQLQELCERKKVVLFAVPGAFTPTCSAQHLPGYLTNYSALKEKGVDSIKRIEKQLQEIFGPTFYKEHIDNIYIQNKNIIIITRSSEARAEVNLQKTTIKTNKTIKVL